jgi:8-amino-3,8-dideoxy-alpha-D-manno-octulosonate transaminase
MPGFEIFGEEEREEVGHVLETGVLFRYGFDQARMGHWKAKTFEKELAERLGVKYCHLCSSGTAALSMALAACGVGAGDEVIIPPFTFVATMEAVLNAGAIPVFSEIDDTLCLDPEALEQVITDNTKAVIPVHMCGSMARIDAVKTVCDKHDLILMEDACQALGGSFKDQSLGTFGQMGCFSFDPVKTITCGEGGAVVTNDDALYNRAHAYADHGHDHVGDDRGQEAHLLLGANYRISELNAAVGLAQLRKLDGILKKQRENKKMLKEGLANIDGVTFRAIPDEGGDSATFLSFFLPNESAAREAVGRLGKAGVDGCFYWYDNNWHYIRQWDHLQNMRSAAPLPLTLLAHPPDFTKIDLPRSDGIMKRTISMLIKLSWSESDMAQRIEQMRKVLIDF